MKKDLMWVVVIIASFSTVPAQNVNNLPKWKVNQVEDIDTNQQALYYCTLAPIVPLQQPKLYP
jgi:hypothetical protein